MDREVKNNSVRVVENAVAPTASSLFAMIRQIGAEGSVVLENGFKYDENVSPLIRTVIDFWRMVEANSDSNPEKFQHGFKSFNAWEEAIEGFGMASPGLLFAYIVDKYTLAKLIDKQDQSGKLSTTTRAAIQFSRFMLYFSLSQFSYHEISTKIGPKLHEILNVGDVPFSLETVLKLFENLRDFIF